MPFVSKRSPSKPKKASLGSKGMAPLGRKKATRGVPARQTNQLKKIFQIGTKSGGRNTANFKSRGTGIGGKGGGGNK